MDAILYVDDEPDLLEIGKLFLEQRGQFGVDIITSASGALDLMKSKHYDAIVSDYQMPGMDGIDFLKQVRSSGNPIPFIIFTGRGREEIIIQALNSGADFYLQKGGDPVSQFTELAHKIRQAVQQRRAEANVRYHERREAEILNFLPDATFAIDTNGIVIAWNRAMEQMTGVAASGILGEGNYEYALPFYHERRPILIDLVLNENPAATARYPNLRRDGRVLLAEIFIPYLKNGEGALLWFTASPLYDDRNMVIGAIESIRDITDKKKVQEELLAKNQKLMTLFEQITANEEALRQNLDELTLSHEALRESEERYRRIVDTANEGVWTMDGDLCTTFFNQQMADIFGYTREEMLGRKVDSLMHPEELEDHQEKIAQRKQGKPEKYERRFLCKDGTVVWALVSATPIFTKSGEFHGSFAMFTDITEQKLIEGALRESERKYRTILEDMQDLLYRTDILGDITMISPVGAKLAGYDSPDELIGHINIRDLYADPGDREQFLVELAENGQVTNYPLTLKAGDGTLRYVTTSSHYYTDAQGTVLGVEGIIHDITEQKKAEEAVIRVNEVLSGQTKTLSILNQIITTANQAVSRQEILNEILNETIDLLDYDAGGIYLVDPAVGTATVVSSRNLPPEFLAKIGTISINSAPYDSLFIGGRPIFTDHYELVSPDHAQKTGFYSVISVPIHSKGRISGALNVVSKRRQVILE